MKKNTIYVIGDIHGDHTKLMDLIEAARRDIKSRSNRNHYFVTLGDYVDRGPDSKKVVETLMNIKNVLPEADAHICLHGNHESMFLQGIGAHQRLVEFDALSGEDKNKNMHRYAAAQSTMQWWLRNGGETTVKSYGGKLPPPEQIVWMSELPRHFELDGFYFVHAGIRPGMPLAQQAEEDKLWIREEFLRDEVTKHGAMVVHGHTVCPEPEFKPNRIALDTGSCFPGKRYGKLTMLVIDAGVPVYYYQSNGYELTKEQVYL